jgi:uncharacterized protein
LPFDPALEAKLIAIVARSSWFMDALKAAQSLQLKSWCIGAGAVRNLVWDQLSGHLTPSALTDVDVAYFDNGDTSPERDQQLQRALHLLRPDIPWEVTNQAGVHHWFADYFGHAVAPVATLAEAVATWPEYATSVGIFLSRHDAIEVIAPHGLADLFSMTIRHNPARASVANYTARISQKQYATRWPRVIVVSPN